MARKRAEHGGALVFTAIFLATVVVPLIILVTNGAHLWRVKAYLQTASDAACEDAAISAADIRAFRELGVVTFGDLAHARNVGIQTFNQVLAGAGRMNFSPGLVIVFDASVPETRCAASATVPLYIVHGTLVMQASAHSQIRFSR